MIQKDKILHVLACASITIIVMILFFIVDSEFVIAALAGAIASTSAGLGKEFGDKVNPYNKWDWKDIVADSIGTAIGIIIAGILWLI